MSAEDLQQHPALEVVVDGRTIGLPACPRHAGEFITGVCSRCGVFVCALDEAEVDGLSYCPACAAHPDVDEVERFRQRCWGRRDLWAWLVMATGFVAALAFPLMLQVNGAVAALLLLCPIIGCGFWLGAHWARKALLFFPLALEVVAVATGEFTDGKGLLGSLGGTGVLVFFALGVLSNTRNQLFFQVDVDRRALEVAHNRHANHPLARAGFQLSLLGLVIWPLAPLAVIAAGLGMARLRADPRPQRLRWRQAMAGVVLGLVGSLLGGAVVAWVVRR